MSRALREFFEQTGLDPEDREAVARFVEVEDFGPSMAVQFPTEEVDINKIMAKVMKGQPILTSQGQPFYGDVTEFGGLQEAIMKVQEADDLFMQYPAETRERFENDPVKFIEFLEDPANKEEALKLGLIKPQPKDTPPVPEPGVSPAK